MREETIHGAILVVWRDERKGRTTVNDMSQLEALLAHYVLPLPDKLPFVVDNEDFLCHCTTDEFPCPVTVERKPKGDVQEAAWAYVENSRMARIEFQDSELGVRFLDEGHFVPFSRLAFDENTGFSIVEDEA